VATFGLDCRKVLVGTGEAISAPLKNKNKVFKLVEPPFPAFKACFSVKPDWHFARDLIESLLTGRCG